VTLRDAVRVRRPADRLGQRIIRCFSVSVLTTALSLVTLAAFTAAVGVTAWIANVLATGLGTVVSYRLNRRWVWGRRGADDPWREVLPFWAMSFTGLTLSTLLVAGAEHWARAAGLGSAARTGLVLLASAAGYAVLWVAQFVVLERLLFVEHHRPPGVPTVPPDGADEPALPARAGGTPALVPTSLRGKKRAR
jgi:putative flippase GtrA